MQVVASDIAIDNRNILDSGKMFNSSDPEIGAALEDVTPLAARTIKIKRDLGAPYPMLARVRTEAMRDSIEPSSVGGGRAAVVVEDDVKSQFQQSTRPFFGVSESALAKTQERCDEAAERIVNQLQGFTATVKITV